MGALKKRLFLSGSKSETYDSNKDTSYTTSFSSVGQAKKKSALDSEFLNRYQEVISGIRFRTYGAIRKLQEKCQV